MEDVAPRGLRPRRVRSHGGQQRVVAETVDSLSSLQEGTEEEGVSVSLIQQEPSGRAIPKGFIPTFDIISWQNAKAKAAVHNLDMLCTTIEPLTLEEYVPERAFTKTRWLRQHADRSNHPLH